MPWLELNTFGDPSALEAQAVAARSYTYSRMPEYLPRDVAIRQASRPYDMRATVSDQVYGGLDAEHAASDRAVRGTRGRAAASWTSCSRRTRRLRS